jgi:L-xylulokinase
LTGQVPFSGSPAALYGWLRDHEPAVFGDLRWILHAKDWIRLRLTGSVATDPTEASASFTDVHTQTWSRAALDLYGLGSLEPALPPIIGSAAVAGCVSADGAAATSLAEGTPVATGAHDVDAAAIGIGAAVPRALSMIFGTFSINQVLADRPVPDPRWQARSFVRPGQWLHMCTSPAGASNLDWAVRRFGPWTSGGEPDPAQAVTEARSRSGQGPAPVFLPYLYGSPHGAGPAATWIGLRGWHERGDLLHAVLEGVVLNHRYHLEMLSEAFALEGSVRLCGGGARSDYWAQMLADAVRRPVEVTDAGEAGSRGAALLAGVAAGTFADIDEAIDRSVRVVRVFQPDSERAAALDRRYRRHLQVMAAVRELQDDEDEKP